MIIINIKDLYPSDSQQQLTDKINYNNNQFLRLGIGQPGPQGAPGARGSQGIPGMPGPRGIRGNYWYSGNYAAPGDDPNMTGSPDIKELNDCYLTYGSVANLAMWQYQGGSPNDWLKIVDFGAIITSVISSVSPFERVGGYSPLPSWGNIILPLTTPALTWKNTLLMAYENQDLLYLGAYSTPNSTSLGKVQAAFLNGLSSRTVHTLMLGEVAYDYTYSGPIMSNPKIGINNTLRITSGYLPRGTTSPIYSYSKFDMSTLDDGSNIAEDTTTWYDFLYRSNSGYRYGNFSASFTNRYAMTRPSMTGYDDIIDSSVDFGGLVIKNTSDTSFDSMVALGTNINFGYPGLSTPYAYLLTNNAITRLHVNNSMVPLRVPSNPTRRINLGEAGGSGQTHWNSIFVRQNIGYDADNLQFWKNTGTSDYFNYPDNCVMTVTKEGRVAIGKDIYPYVGIGNINGVTFGALPAVIGNSNNQAVLHIYEDVIAAPAVQGLTEAGLIVEKRWNYLDSYALKQGAHIHNVVNIGASPLGYGVAPDAIGLSVHQGQSSTNSTFGGVGSMTGIKSYLYSAANAQPVGAAIGVSSKLEFLLDMGTSSASADTFIAYGADMPASRITGTDAYSGLKKNYGFFQMGANNALNYLSGHLQFAGSGFGYSIPGAGVVPGHVINVVGPGGLNGSLSIVSASSYAVGTIAGQVNISGGTAMGSTGGEIYITGGMSMYLGTGGGNVLITGGTGSSSMHGIPGGNLTLTGGHAIGPQRMSLYPSTTQRPGNVYIVPGVSMSYAYQFNPITDAGSIAIGYLPAGAVNNVGFVGFGTHAPKEKVQVMGNIALGGNDGVNVRKIYARRGMVGATVNDETNGDGILLAVSAGDGYNADSSVTQQGGDLYLYGGKQHGVPRSPEWRWDGNTVLAFTEDGNSVGRVGIRMRPSTSTIYDIANVHIDVTGNVRTNGDIMWGTDSAVGWTYIENFAGPTTYDQNVRVFYEDTGSPHLPIELTYSTLSASSSSVIIKCKRMGTVAVINYYVNLVNIGAINGSTKIYLAWDSSAAFNNALGKFNPIRSYAAPLWMTSYNQPADAAYACGIGADENAAHFAFEANAAVSSTACGTIPVDYNVLTLYTVESTSQYRYLHGQIIVPMV